MKGSLYPSGGGFEGHIKNSFKTSYIAVLVKHFLNLLLFLSFKTS